ncbi:MAG: aminotransferase class V-fold PLP-dependent enzyme [Ruminococcaceae bacterium]|nr:aminotransferase class V-fold PLP-dependent enzyme [Oscillospiraceae bacterium]
MIYLDNAATTQRKPDRVYQAVRDVLYRGASAGRGAYPAAALAADRIYACRTELCALFNVPSEEQIVFTHNATMALNMAIKGLLTGSGEVVVSGYEHNAVTRPLHALSRQGVRFIPAVSPLFDRRGTLDAFSRLITGDTALVVCTHVSNVFGMIMPIEEIDELCARRDVPLIIDASQSAGSLDLDFASLRAARFVCMPGHKGLYGPQGTGVLLCRDGCAETLFEGGTGSDSASYEQPSYLPDRFEAGTQNAAGIAGLCEGVKFVRERTPARILQHEQQLIARAVHGLSRIPGVHCYAAPDGDQAGVLSFETQQMDCAALAHALACAGIAVRAGLHCAALAHRTADTLDRGTVRISVSAFSSCDDIDALCSSVRAALSARKSPVL